ncbi:MAG: DUF4337 domain-containing protein [Thermoguttaceae bacterium]|jgi:hypothetical protein
MEAPEVPLEQSQEAIIHHAHEAPESWIMGVALTAALLAVLAAITSLMAEHYANEAMIEQIQSSDQWSYYQAKGIKASVLGTKIELREELGKTVDPADREKLSRYAADQKRIDLAAREKEQESTQHLRRHNALSPAVTMFQVAIAVSAIAVLTRRRLFWYVAIAFGIVGLGFFVHGSLLMPGAEKPAKPEAAWESRLRESPISPRPLARERPEVRALWENRRSGCA